MKPLQTLTSTIENLTEEATRRTADDVRARTSGADRTDRADRADGDDESGRTGGSGGTARTGDGPPDDGDDDPGSNGGSNDDRPGGGTGDESSPDDGWTTVETDVEKTLNGVVRTVNGVYAVGSGGTVARRAADGSWSVVVPGGPAAKRNALTCVDVTDDRERIWFAGSSGALGMYDTTTGRKFDYTAPMEMTSTWEAVGIAGERGDERLFVANGSGEVVAGSVDENDCLSVEEPVKPGSGSTIAALDVRDDVVHAVDTSGNVFALRDGEWTDVGIENAQINFTDVDAGPDGRVLVTGGGGIVYRYDPPCGNWTPLAVGTVVLRAIDRRGDRLVVVGDGGHAYERDPQEGWTTVETATEATLHDVALGPTDVAVGEGGAIVERPGRSDDGPDADGPDRGGGPDADGSAEEGGSEDEDGGADGDSGSETNEGTDAVTEALDDSRSRNGGEDR